MFQTPLYDTDVLQHDPLLFGSQYSRYHKNISMIKYEGYSQVDSINEWIGGLVIHCVAQLAMIKALFENITLEMVLYKYCMSGYIATTLNSILYVTNNDNMHYGIGMKPAAVWTSSEI